jgi:hypothetical protein
MHEQVAVWGSADECAERLHRIAADGAELIVLTALFDHAWPECSSRRAY